MTTKLLPVPWPDPVRPGACTYTDRELRKMAVEAARSEKGRLLDWRIILRDGGHHTMQVRYVLRDGIARFHNIAI